MWCVYILRCSDDSYYVGHTDDLSLRVSMHNSGRAAKWTACRLPVRLVYSEPQGSEQQAILRERQIKRWSRGKKEALITGDTEALKTLAERKTHPVPAKKAQKLASGRLRFGSKRRNG